MIKLSFTTFYVEAALPICVLNVGLGSAPLSLPPLPLPSGGEEPPFISSLLSDGPWGADGFACDSSFIFVCHHDEKSFMEGWMVEGGWEVPQVGVEVGRMVGWLINSFSLYCSASGRLNGGQAKDFTCSNWPHWKYSYRWSQAKDDTEFDTVVRWNQGREKQTIANYSQNNPLMEWVLSSLTWNSTRTTWSVKLRVLHFGNQTPFKQLCDATAAMDYLDNALKHKSKQDKIASVNEVIQEVRNRFNTCEYGVKWTSSEKTNIIG